MIHYDVIVIGGGASGMMAAGRAGERGRKVLLLEKNSVLGKKLAITGGGRCNILNAEENERLLLSHFGSAAKFLYSPFSQFGMQAAYDFFEHRDLPLVVQGGQRAFPKSEKAEHVVRVLERYLRDGKVEVRMNASVKGFVTEDKKIVGIKVGSEIATADSYILATGGQSHRETGSTGDGWRWLQTLGLDVVQPTPTIVPLAVSDPWITSLSGQALDNIKISFSTPGLKKLVLKGRILCTHFGLSGPLILNAAAKVADMLQSGSVTGGIDLFPTKDLGALDTYILEIFDQNKNKGLKNVMKCIVPPGTANAILTLLPDIDLEKKVHSISKAERKTIVHVLKALPVAVTGLMGFNRAVIADGGLELNEIDGKTMRSRKYPNLFVTGDMLNISRPSGGYSLQLCWTTGWVAGSQA